MATKVHMEALSPTMEEGRLVKWTKHEGDPVKSGDTLAEVETDKAVMELVARADGQLIKVVVPEGTTVPVGNVVAWIGKPGEKVDGAGSGEQGAAAPKPAATAAAPAPVLSAPPQRPAPTPAPALAPETAPAPAAVAAAAAPSASVDDEEIHKKAKRFAKLLVDEIKLYNQQKVADGRANKDLYSRLKDDLDKSRISYEKRYGQTAAGHSDYFNEELIRILCDGDASVLGSGYSR